MASAAHEHTVLLVEDDSTIRESISEVLEDEGFRVLAAAHGREALDVLSRAPRPCLVLLDLMMPVMTGWEFLEVVKRHRDYSSIPVVVVSAAAELAPQGIHGCVKKPINLRTLLDTVSSHCSA